MRKNALPFAGPLIALTVAAACGDQQSPTAPTGELGPRPTVVTHPLHRFSIPDTVYADEETGTCDIPFSVESYYATQAAYVDSAQLSAGYRIYQLPQSYWNLVMGPIFPGAGQTTYMRTRNLSPAPYPPPYSGTLIAYVNYGSERLTMYLEFTCLPAIPSPPPPPEPNGPYILPPA